MSDGFFNIMSNILSLGPCIFRHTFSLVQLLTSNISTVLNISFGLVVLGFGRVFRVLRIAASASLEITSGFLDIVFPLLPGRGNLIFDFTSFLLYISLKHKAAVS